MRRTRSFIRPSLIGPKYTSQMPLLADAKTRGASCRDWYEREGASIVGAREDTLEQLVPSQFVDCSSRIRQR